MKRLKLGEDEHNDELDGLPFEEKYKLWLQDRYDALYDEFALIVNPKAGDNGRFGQWPTDGGFIFNAGQNKIFAAMYMFQPENHQYTIEHDVIIDSATSLGLRDPEGGTSATGFVSSDNQWDMWTLHVESEEQAIKMMKQLKELLIGLGYQDPKIRLRLSRLDAVVDLVEVEKAEQRKQSIEQFVERLRKRKKREGQNMEKRLIKAEDDQVNEIEQLKIIDEKLRAKGFTPRYDVQKFGGTWEKDYNGLQATCTVDRQRTGMKWALTYKIWTRESDLETIEYIIDEMDI